MWLLLITLFTSTLSLFHIEHNGSPIVQIKQGIIRGRLKYSNTVTRTPYYSFQGIPFAKPPIGNLRFHPAQPPEKFEGIFDAFHEGNSCPQFPGGYMSRIGNEDCLYLNVYTRHKISKMAALMPVMVWIHGGGYFFGSCNSSTMRTFSPYGPDYLIEENVVIVTFNYRLNVFGFFSTMDEAAYGNVGLKDQVAALRWVKDNIRSFGGDPETVTIFGESAGGASILYLMQSPLAAGIFKRAIIQSGTNLNRWAVAEDPRTKAFQLGRGLGIHTNDSKQLVEELRKLNYIKLFNAAHSTSMMGKHYPMFTQSFLPCVERDNPLAIITRSSYENLKTGRYHSVPVIIGHTTAEGSYALLFVENEPHINPTDFTRNPVLLVPRALNLPKFCEETVIVAQKIQKHFCSNGTIAEKENFIKYMSEELFVRGIRKTVEFLRQSSVEVFFYVISYKGSSTGNFSGVGHAEELPYLWRPLDIKNESKMDIAFRTKLIRLWTNFARTGDPTPDDDPVLNVKWPRVSAHNKKGISYLDIGSELRTRKYLDRNFIFWERLFNEHGRTPFSIW